jgi:hypothetical protein
MNLVLILAKTVAHQSSFFLLKIIKKLTIWLTIKDDKFNWWSTVMRCEIKFDQEDNKKNQNNQIHFKTL